VYKIEKEIFSQYKALKRTYDYFMGKAQEIRGVWEEHSSTSITFIGCGSGYCICQSGEISAKMKLGLPANSIPAGDLMLNFPHYAKVMKDTLIIAPSRSGSTSEVILSVKNAQDSYGTPCISICAKEDSEISRLADLNLEIPWAFDESVCQTRTVTNFYGANLLLIGILGNDTALLDEIKGAIDAGEDYMKEYTQSLKEIGQRDSWKKVVVLGDSELQGIASEGALAFKEICRIPSNYYHLLDARHGPMVLVDDQTLVIMACSPFGDSYQKGLISDIKGRGAQVVTVGKSAAGKWGGDMHIATPDYNNYGVMGIPFIFVPQVIAYFRAIHHGINPDLPEGLAPWIKL
jgi:glucosamine--fructose-6-phosphate aminotransferase (isomerizing)